MPPLHVHGQEIAIVLKGYGKVVTADGKEYPIKEGEAIIMPPGLPHTGTFDAPDNLVVSITTPRRPEYGAHDQTTY
jgi:quercetin dioxygenase-like cupin family protein